MSSNDNLIAFNPPRATPEHAPDPLSDMCTRAILDAMVVSLQKNGMLEQFDPVQLGFATRFAVGGMLAQLRRKGVAEAMLVAWFTPEVVRDA